ncbi:MAG: diguanylate cyclase (GGDEF)-like protein [Lentisphaeria bacterium]|jgi:diguanylate cyclase (GGDEF)-like protein
MVTLASSHPQRLRKISTGVNGFPGENELKDLRFKLAYNLQSTLDLQTAIELFFDNIQDLVKVPGLTYSYKDAGIEIEVGEKQIHTAAYKIASTNTQLGQITFCRSACFVEPELAVLEMLIGILFFPLRNALLYREALESSLRDTLTGIGNRAAMDMSFSREIKLAQRHQQELSLLVIDIDYFKQVNDNAGHRSGDKALQCIAKNIQNTLRETDQIFRFGGEEFVALLNNTGLTEAKLIAERIRINVAMSPIAFEDQELMLTISIGVSDLNADDTTDTLFEKADSALYRAKDAGRNRVMTSSELDSKQSAIDKKWLSADEMQIKSAPCANTGEM